MHNGHAMVVAAGEEKKGVDLKKAMKTNATPPVVVSSASLSELDALGLNKSVPVLQVRDNGKAVLDFARFAREQFNGKVIGVTGSAGKTTTVHMISHALQGVKSVPHTKGNANLPFGVAWNLCQMDWDANYYALELAIGKMAINANLAKPDVAVITNIAPAHLIYHGSTENIARKKSLIFSGVKADGVAVICIDTLHADILIAEADRCGLKTVTYGVHADADFKLNNWCDSSRQVKVESPDGILTYNLASEAFHFVHNSMACLAVCHALQYDFASAMRSFANFEAISGRGDIVSFSRDQGSIHVIDESYNANPLSMQSSISYASAKFRNGAYRRLVLVLGDMLELGGDEVMHHVDLADAVLSAKPDALVLCGTLMHHLADGVAGEVPNLVLVNALEDVLIWCNSELHSGDLVLFKSSHGTGLYKVVNELRKLA